MMTYESSLLFTPDKYSHAFVYDLDATGEIVLTSEGLYLPARTSYIIIDTAPLIGTIKLNGVSVIAESSGNTPTQIQRTDIDNGLLVWSSGLSETSERLQFDFYALDSADEIQSLFYDWLPANAILEPSEIVDGGNFNTNLTLGGVDADAGDFNTGTDSAKLQSYSGGNFDTGEAVLPTAPLVEFSLAETDALSVIDPDTLQLVDTQTLQTVHETHSREPLFFRFDLSSNFTYEVYYQVRERQFAGWDYGNIVPDFGYSIDYGTIATPSQEGYDFSSIVNHVVPYPSSSVT